jgi:hypothetical protein
VDADASPAASGDAAASPQGRLTKHPAADGHEPRQIALANRAGGRQAFGMFVLTEATPPIILAES